VDGSLNSLVHGIAARRLRNKTSVRAPCVVFNGPSFDFSGVGVGTTYFEADLRLKL